MDGAAEIARRSCARWEEGVGGEVRERAGGEQRGARGERAQGSPATAARQRGEKVSRRKGFAVYFAKCEQTRGAGQASDGEERGRAQKEWMLHWSEPASPELIRPPLRTPIPGPLPRPGTLPDPLAPPGPSPAPFSAPPRPSSRSLGIDPGACVATLVVCISRRYNITSVKPHIKCFCRCR